MIVKFVQIRDDSGYYDPNALSENTKQKGKLVYGFSLREIYVDPQNISHFHISDKFENRKQEISKQLDLNENASYTQMFFKHGPTKNIVVIGDTESIKDKIEGYSSANAKRK